MNFMNGHGSRNLLSGRNVAPRELRRPQRISCVCAHTGHNQDYIHISILHRDIHTYTPSVTAPQSTHSQRNSHVASIWDDLSMFSLRPPLLKRKNTSRILKHASQSKGRKVAAKVFTTKSCS